MRLKDGPGFAFQNSKPDSLLKMEEEQRLEKCPLSGSKDPKFSFSFNKRLLGYVRPHAHVPLARHTCTPPPHTHALTEGFPGEAHLLSRQTPSLPPGLIAPMGGGGGGAEGKDVTRRLLAQLLSWAG